MVFTLSDYKKDNVTTEEEAYNIGTERGIRFFSDETTIFASIDCLVRFNNDSIWIPVHGGIGAYFIFKRTIYLVYYKTKSGSGTIEIWAEGSRKR